MASYAEDYWGSVSFGVTYNKFGVPVFVNPVTGMEFRPLSSPHDSEGNPDYDSAASNKERVLWERNKEIIGSRILMLWRRPRGKRFISKTIRVPSVGPTRLTLAKLSGLTQEEYALLEPVLSTDKDGERYLDFVFDQVFVPLGKDPATGWLIASPVG